MAKPRKKRNRRSSFRRRRKQCRFCSKDLPRIDYKDVETLRDFVTDRGKMLSRRVTGNCAKHQRQISRQIKRARYIALMPYVAE